MAEAEVVVSEPHYCTKDSVTDKVCDGNRGKPCTSCAEDIRLEELANESQLLGLYGKGSYDDEDSP